MGAATTISGMAKAWGFPGSGPSWGEIALWGGGLLGLLLLSVVAAAWLWNRRLRRQMAFKERALRERVKEQACLYGVSAVLDERELVLERVLERVVWQLPGGWQYPPITCARITYGDIQVQTPDFARTSWRQEAPIVVQGEKAGRIEVAYLEPRPERDEGPFLKEERALITELARQLGTAIDRRLDEEALRAHSRSLEEQVELTAQAQARAEAAHYQLTEALESLAEGFALFDAEDRLVLFNTRFKEEFVTVPDVVKFGLHFEALLQAVVERGQVPPGYASPEEWAAERLERHRHPTGPFQFRRSDGRYILVSEHLTPDGDHVGVYSDITELHQHRHHLEELVEERTAELQAATEKLERSQEALRLARDQAEKASQAKGEFLANMSHEIRTPLNGVIGMAELLERTELSEQQAEYVELIQKSADTLLGLINNILDFSKIEAGRLELESIPFPLRDTLSDTLQTLSLHAADKGLELAVHIPPEVPDRVLGDPVRLRQVVVNLVGNAIKFTEQGEVVVDVRLLSLDEQGVRLGIEIVDTGVGIAEEKRQRIFEAFGQADSSTTRQSGGTGLGLTIAAQLVALMGGRIEVGAAPGGQGSRFAFTIVLGVPQEGGETPASPSPPELQGLAVLVVDDNATNRRILEEILASWGMHPVCVPGGREALEAIEQAEEAGERFPLALLDMMMPRMDGLALAERIRAHPPHAAMPILLLSSGGHSGDPARRGQLGISRLLLKPLKQSDLLDAIGEALGSGALGGGDEGGASPSAVTPRRVLLVEDGLTNQKVATDLLRQRGHEVVLAENGRLAIEAVEGRAFDVVLMDVQMPVMDGLEAARAIRERERGSERHLPIIAMTASATKHDREQCLEAGMDDFVAKPFRAAELYAAVEGARSPVEAEAATGPPAAAEASTGDAGEPPCLDWQAALAALDGNREMLVELVAMFFEEGARLLGEIDAALAAGEARDLRRAAHTLKGSARMVGGLAVGEAAQRLEALAKAGDLDAAGEARETLAKRLAELTPALEAALDDDGSR